MNKKWTDMTNDEKLEVLRHMMNSVRGGFATRAQLLTLHQLTADLRVAVSKLEQRFDALDRRRAANVQLGAKPALQQVHSAQVEKGGN